MSYCPIEQVYLNSNGLINGSASFVTGMSINKDGSYNNRFTNFNLLNGSEIGSTYVPSSSYFYNPLGVDTSQIYCGLSNGQTVKSSYGNNYQGRNTLSMSNLSNTSSQHVSKKTREEIQRAEGHSARSGIPSSYFRKNR